MCRHKAYYTAFIYGHGQYVRYRPSFYLTAVSHYDQVHRYYRLVKQECDRILHELQKSHFCLLTGNKKNAVDVKIKKPDYMACFLSFMCLNYVMGSPWV